MVMLLGVLVCAELNRNGVSLQGVLSLDADEKGASTPGGNTLPWEMDRLEAASESTFELKWMNVFYYHSFFKTFAPFDHNEFSFGR